MPQNYFLDHARGSGRTKAMIARLPVSGSTILVHSTLMRDYVRQMVLDVRGVVVCRRTRILVAVSIGAYDQVANSDRPVFADHAWSENISRPVYDAIAPLLHDEVRLRRIPRRQIERRVKP